MYEEIIKSLRLCREILHEDDSCIEFVDGSCEAFPICAYQLMEKAADAIEELSNGSEKVVMDYCRKRNLVLITYKSFETLKAYYNRGVMPLTEPPKEET